MYSIVSPFPLPPPFFIVVLSSFTEAGCNQVDAAEGLLCSVFPVAMMVSFSVIYVVFGFLHPPPQYHRSTPQAAC